MSLQEYVDYFFSIVSFVDVVALIVFLIFVNQGFKFGFIRAVGNLLAFILTGYVAVTTSEYAARFVYNMTGARESLTSTIESYIVRDGVVLSGQALLGALNDFVGGHRFLGSFFTELLENNAYVVDAVASGVVVSPHTMLNSIVGGVEPVVLFAIRVVTFFVIAIAVYTLSLMVCSFIARVISKIPILGSIDRLLGAMLGAVAGVLGVAVVVAVMFLVVGATGGVGVLTSESLHNSFVFNMLLELQKSVVSLVQFGG